MVFFLENLAFMRLFEVTFSFLSGLENGKRYILERNNYEQVFLNPLVHLMILKKQLVSMYIPAPFALESCIGVCGVDIWRYRIKYTCPLSPENLLLNDTLSSTVSLVPSGKRTTA